MTTVSALLGVRAIRRQGRRRRRHRGHWYAGRALGGRLGPGPLSCLDLYFSRTPRRARATSGRWCLSGCMFFNNCFGTLGAAKSTLFSCACAVSARKQATRQRAVGRRCGDNPYASAGGRTSLRTAPCSSRAVLKRTSPSSEPHPPAVVGLMVVRSVLRAPGCPQQWRGTDDAASASGDGQLAGAHRRQQQCWLQRWAR